MRESRKSIVQVIVIMVFFACITSASAEMVITTKDGRILKLPVNNSDVVKIEYLPSGTSSVSQGFNVGAKVKVTRKDGNTFEGKIVKMYSSADAFYSKNVLVKKNIREFKKVVTTTVPATYNMVTLDGKTIEAYSASTLYDFDVDVDILGVQRFSNNGAILSVEVLE